MRTQLIKYNTYIYHFIIVSIHRKNCYMASLIIHICFVLEKGGRALFNLQSACAIKGYMDKQTSVTENFGLLNHVHIF